MVTGDWEAFESAVLDGLRRISLAEAGLADAAGDDEADAAEDELDQATFALRAVFSPYPAAARRLNQLWSEAMGGVRGAEPVGPAGSVRNHLYLEVPVFYATDRGPAPVTGERDAGGWYTGDPAAADELSFGVIRVSVPERRHRGRLPKPRLWHLGFDPRRFAEIIGVDRMDEPAFAGDPRLALPPFAGDPRTTDEADEHDVLLFVHGYNVAFADAARRAAQLAYDINFPGVPMLYSWPSKGVTPGYVADRENAYASVEHLADFLRLILGKLGPRRIHVIAHSMGNHVLVEALHLLTTTQDRRLGQVVMIAPDVPENLFHRRAATFGALATRCTVYASARDRALKLSAWLSGNPRAGQGVVQAAPAATVDTIDTSSLPGDLLNHSTFAQNPVFLNDIEALVRLGRPPAQRAGLRSGHEPGGATYWRLDG